MIQYFLELWKAWCRGEHRCAPRGVRGRVYTPCTHPGLGAISHLKAHLTLRVYRKAEDRWDDIKGE